MHAQALAAVFLVLVAVSNANWCGCPVTDENECNKRRNFLALRYLNVSDVPSVPSNYETIGDAIFAVMQVKYNTGLDYFTKTLATDGNACIAEENEIMTKEDKCYHAQMKKLSFTLPNGAEHLVDLELRSRALDKGVSIEICHCTDRNNSYMNADGNERPAECNDELLEYLRERAEFRMTEIVDNMRMPAQSP